jgi:hypothetical protein
MAVAAGVIAILALTTDIALRDVAAQLDGTAARDGSQRAPLYRAQALGSG